MKQRAERQRRLTEGGWQNADAIDKQLRNLYYAAGDPGSYGGVDRLYKRAKELGIPVTRKRVSEFLTNQLAYSIHKPARHKFIRNHTIVSNIDQQWQADLADMQSLSDVNDGYHYILTCIDILSRFAWAVPVRSKSGKDMLVAMKRLFQVARPRRPQRLQTDKGNEFFNATVSAYLRAQNVHHFASHSDQKAAVVERFNRTLKNRIWTYFTSNNTKRYVNVLGDIVSAYNNTVHRSTRMRPIDIDGEQAAQKAWYQLYYHATSTGAQRPKKPPKPLPLEQRVRIAKWKGGFEKGYIPNWSREHFTIRKHLPHPQSLYNIEDASGEPIEGAFYNAELQPVTRNRLEVERVLERRGRRGSVHSEVLVKWRGWPDKFNRWIPHRDLVKYEAAPRMSYEHDYVDA
jgi:hypothetical protein